MLAGLAGRIYDHAPQQNAIPLERTTAQMPGTDGARPDRFLRFVSMTNGGMRMERELTPDEDADYLRAVSLLRDHDRAAALVDIARRNLSALKGAVDDITRQIPKTTNRAALQREAQLELNRHFLNFLAAFRQFLDHTETRLKRSYADQPAVYEAFRKATSEAYDSAFAYRFIYKLRNFGQHCGAPIGEIELESAAIGNSGFVEHTAHLRYEPAQLVAQGGDVWGAKVRKELEAMDEKFPALPLAEEALTKLDAIWLLTRDAERTALRAAGSTVQDILRRVNGDARGTAVVRLWHRKRSTTFQFHSPPVPTMKWLGFDGFAEPL